jgi:hypothetical protein
MNYELIHKASILPITVPAFSSVFFTINSAKVTNLPLLYKFVRQKQKSRISDSYP